MSTSTADEQRDAGHRVHVVLRHRIDEILAHAVPAEDLFGERRADEQQRELVREERGHRNERRAQAMLDQRARSAQALRAGSAQEVAAEHVEHRVALVAAVERDGDRRSAPATAARDARSGSRCRSTTRDRGPGVISPVV